MYVDLSIFCYIKFYFQLIVGGALNIKGEEREKWKYYKLSMILYNKFTL